LANPLQHDRALILSTVLGLLGFAVVALVSFPINWYVPGFFVMLYLSIIASYSKKNIVSAKVKYNFFTVILSVLTSLFLAYYVFISYQSEYYFRLSILNFKLDHKEQSVFNIKKSLQYKKSYKFYSKAGLYLLSVDKPKEAIEYLLEAKKRSLFKAASLLNLAEAYRVTGLYENEQSILKLILIGDNKNVVASSRLVRSLVFRNKYDEADPFYRQMKVNFDYFKDVEAYGPYHAEVSKAALLVEDYKYFGYVYDDLIKRGPTAEDYAVYGIVEYQRIGNKSKAKKLFTKAIELDPNIEIPQEIKNDLGL
jgi:tetratricopeptide (TPR) repeat protein